MSGLYSNSIFFVEVDKIKPNPFQPRREFDASALQTLADSIRQYGVLQPLTVSRVEREKDDGGLVVEYELIAGERRLRASKLATLKEVPVIIRVGDDNMTKLELAIIENLQREDLNAVDRARAFLRLADEFKFNNVEIGRKVGKSREYVSNTLRILSLPQEILDALSEGKINEGHTRPLMMLVDRPEEQITLFKEIVIKKISVREAERIARKIAYDKIRKRELMPDPEISDIEIRLQEALGTRVHIERKQVGGQITIDFFTSEDLRTILDLIKNNQEHKPGEMLERYAATLAKANAISPTAPKQEEQSEMQATDTEPMDIVADTTEMPETSPQEDITTQDMEDRSPEEIKTEEETDLYNVKNFSL